MPGPKMQAGKKVLSIGSAIARTAIGMNPLGALGLAGFDAGKSMLAGKKAVGRKGGGFFSVGKRGVVGVIGKNGKTKTIRVNATAHIGKNMPNHRQITRLRRNLHRHRADAITILRIVSPGSLRSAGGGRRQGRRIPQGFRGRRNRRR